MKDILDILMKTRVCGEFTHIAKGKNELVTDFKSALKKITMLWQSRRKL